MTTETVAQSGDIAVVVRYLPPSITGWCLIAQRHLASWFLTPSWKAPFFVLSFDDCDDEEPIKPMLYHAENFEMARSVGRRVLNADFMPVSLGVSV